MSALQETGKLIEKRRLTETIYDYRVLAPRAAERAVPGQFANLLCEGFFLRRPISICDFDAAAGTLRFVFEVRGEGTRWLSTREPGEAIDLVAPLGHGFEPLPAGKVVFVGGGIGVPPLYGAAKRIGRDATVLVGFRSASAQILLSDFEKAGCDVRVATDDGTAGRHGFVTELLRERLDEGKVSAVCACGPKPMLRAVAALAEGAGAECWVSLEERMACGVGACLGCASETKRADGTKYMAQVCKKGPVFNAKEVVW